MMLSRRELRDQINALWTELREQYPYVFSYNIFDEQILPKLPEIEEWLANNCGGDYNCFPPYKDQNDIIVHVMAIFIEQKHDAEMFRLVFNLPLNKHGLHS